MFPDTWSGKGWQGNEKEKMGRRARTQRGVPDHIHPSIHRGTVRADGRVPFRTYQVIGIPVLFSSWESSYLYTYAEAFTHSTWPSQNPTFPPAEPWLSPSSG